MTCNGLASAPLGTMSLKPLSGPACVTEMDPPPVPTFMAGNVAPTIAAVATNLTGASDPTVTLSTLRPSAWPSVQSPAVATPLVPVVADAAASVPPPESTENVYCARNWLARGIAYQHRRLDRHGGCRLGLLSVAGLDGDRRGRITRGWRDRCARTAAAGTNQHGERRRDHNGSHPSLQGRLPRRAGGRHLEWRKSGASGARTGHHWAFCAIAR